MIACVKVDEESKVDFNSKTITKNNLIKINCRTNKKSPENVFHFIVTEHILKTNQFYLNITG